MIWEALGVPRLPKMLTLRNLLSGKHALERSQGCGWETFAGEIRQVTHGSDWSFQQTPAIETGLSRKGVSRCAPP